MFGDLFSVEETPLAASLPSLLTSTLLPLTSALDRDPLGPMQLAVGQLMAAFL